MGTRGQENTSSNYFPLVWRRNWLRGGISGHGVLVATRVGGGDGERQWRWWNGWHRHRGGDSVWAGRCKRRESGWACIGCHGRLARWRWEREGCSRFRQACFQMVDIGESLHKKLHAQCPRTTCSQSTRSEKKTYVFSSVSPRVVYSRSGGKMNSMRGNVTPLYARSMNSITGNPFFRLAMEPQCCWMTDSHCWAQAAKKTIPNSWSPTECAMRQWGE